MHDATYSPEDNKLRLYAAERLDADTYAQVKAAGFRWAPKQELFVAPSWSPAREDLLIELCGEIGDENTSAADRSADRAERFSGYREKRRHEAHGHADSYDSGPGVFGHQNRQRAERQARRHDRHRSHAVNQWAKAEYWQQRTEGVISTALYKMRPSVRRGRVLKIEAEQRKHTKTITEATETWQAWQQVLTLDGIDTPGVIIRDGWNTDITQSAAGFRLAYTLANSGRCWRHDYQHPRDSERQPTSLFTLLTDEADPITPAEAAAMWLDGMPADGPAAEGSYSARWAAHYDLRLTYERAMLANEGGTAAEADIEPGGFFGNHQVIRVHKSPKTKRITSIGVWGPHQWRTNADGTSEMGVQNVNIERFPENAYRAPTDEERAAFKAEQKAKKTKATTKAKANPKPTLINPTREAAQAIQDVLNAAAEACCKRANLYTMPTPSEVWEMTQAEYSHRSKGSYGSCETRELREGGKLAANSNMYSGDTHKRAIACKLRSGFAGSNNYNGAYRIVVLSDKPQKPLPDWSLSEETAKKLEEVAA